MFKITSVVLKAAELGSTFVVWDRNNYFKELGDSSAFKEVEVIEKRMCFYLQTKE